jgi:hypothetical protein
MSTGRIAAILLAGAGMGPLLANCLPGDIRPTPATVHMTAEGSAAVTSGLTTDDGWKITFERLLVGIGDATLGGSSCDDYADARYDRLFDFTVKGPQKLSDLYGVGACRLRLRLRVPAFDALLQEGVSTADLALMRTAGDDAFAKATGVSVYVRGHAAQGAVTKHFEWKFRLGFSLHDCGSDVGDAGSPAPDAGDTGDAGTLDLVGGAAPSIDVVVHGEELFRNTAHDGAPLFFDGIAIADINDDQAITLDELAKVPTPLPDFDAGAGADAGPPSRASFMYETLVPRMIHVGTFGPCQADIRGFGR